MYIVVAENSLSMTLESKSFGFVVKIRAHYQLSRESQEIDIKTLNSSEKNTALFVLGFVMNLVINGPYATSKGKINQKVQQIKFWC